MFASQLQKKNLRQLSTSTRETYVVISSTMVLRVVSSAATKVVMQYLYGSFSSNHLPIRISGWFYFYFALLELLQYSAIVPHSAFASALFEQQRHVIWWKTVPERRLHCLIRKFLFQASAGSAFLAFASDHQGASAYECRRQLYLESVMHDTVKPRNYGSVYISPGTPAYIWLSVSTSCLSAQGALKNSGLQQVHEGCILTYLMMHFPK